MIAKVKTFYTLVLIALILHRCVSDDIIGCDNPEILQELKNTEALDLSFTGEIKTFMDVKISSIISIENNDFDELYIDAKLEEFDDDVDLVIFTTKNFENYMKKQTIMNIVLSVNFECTGDSLPRTLLFVQPLKEGNYSPPKFSKNVYKFVIPTPLYKGFELTTFEEISATDDDIKGFDINFSSNDSEVFNILVGKLQKQETKTSFASLQSMSVLLALHENIEFSIIATDTGSPPRSSLPAQVIITADESNSFPPIPKFEQTIVYGTLTKDLKLAELELSLDPSTYSRDVNFEKLSDDDDVFEITNKENVVLVTLKKELDLDFLKGKEKLSFEVEASNSRMPVSGRAVVSISLPKKTETHFKTEFYAGKLFVKTNILEIEHFELIGDESELGQMDLSLQGKHSKSFEIENTQNMVKLSVKSDVSAKEWGSEKFISLTLLAKMNEEESVSTNVMIDIIHTTLAFEKPAFTGSITPDVELDLEPIDLLTDADETTDVEIKLLESDAKFFTFTRKENQIELELQEDFDPRNLKGRCYLSIEIEAEEIRTGVKARCHIFIEIINSESEMHFKSQLYEGKFIVKANILEIEDFEILGDEQELEQLQLSLQGKNANLFDLDEDHGLVKIVLKPGADANEWRDKNYVSFVLTAKNSGEAFASTNIIILVIHTTLEFEKSAYTGLINSDYELVLDPIVLLTNENNTNDVDIQLLQDDADIFGFTKTGNEVDLELSENFNETILRNKSYLSLEVEAVDIITGVNTSCLIFIEIVKAVNVLKFEKSLYEGQMDFEAEISLEDVVLNQDSSGDDIDFFLSGRDAEYLTFQRIENNITFTTKKNFNITDHIDSSVLWLELKAVNSKDNLEAVTVVMLHIIHDPIPQFEDVNYIGELQEDNSLSMKKIILKASTWRKYTVLEITGEFSNFFSLKTFENEVELENLSELPEEALVRNSIVLVLTASNNIFKSYSTVVINLPKSQQTANIFKKPIQKGKVEENRNIQVLKIDDVELVKEYTAADFTCTISGDVSKSLDYTVIAPKNVIKLILAAELPSYIIQHQFYVTAMLECQSKEDASLIGSTIIFLDLPGKSGQLVCPTPEPPTFVPEFQKALYNLYAKPSYVGSLQSVRAVIKGSRDPVEYSLHVVNDHLKSRIDIDSSSGEIVLTGVTSPGIYYFDVYAENSVTNGQDKAKVMLTIEALIQCEDHVAVSNSLLVRYLEEEVDHGAIISARLGDCEFYVFSVEPANGDYVKIDSATKMLSMKSVDREDSSFSHMTQPQVEVKLKLECLSERLLLRGPGSWRDARATENDSQIIANDIPFAKDVTLLSIVIVDINDNQPEFVYPNTERWVVGFPVEKVSMELFSENIMQVVAVDKDSGLNAKIRYSIQPNEHFQIDPDSGEVYPYANAMKGISEISLFVYATDRDGASDGLSSKFSMIVKALMAEHFTLLTFVNENIDDIDKLMEDVRNSTNIDFVVVKHAVVPSSEIGDTNARAKSVQFVRKVWVYTFDKGEPMSSKDVKQKLSEAADGDINISAETFEEVLAANKIVEIGPIQDLSGYIAGVCILTIGLVACIGFIAWRYIYIDHSLLPRNSGDSMPPRNQLNQNFNAKSGFEYGAKKNSDILTDIPYDPSLYSKKDGVKVFGTTTQETADYGRRRQVAKMNFPGNGILKEEEEEESDSSNESHQTRGSESGYSNESHPPRATVTFNEMVERIHIERDNRRKANYERSIANNMYF